LIGDNISDRSAVKIQKSGRASAASNVRWVGITQAGRVGIQLVSVVVFSRLLAPSDYGLMAMAAVVINFGGLFRDMGTSAALIQRKDLAPDLLDTVFWLNVILGLVVGIFVAILAPVAAWVFSADALTAVLLALSVIFPIASTTAPHLALLERHSEFRSIAWVEVSSGVTGLVAGIIFALIGGGVYSLVLQGVLTAAVSAIQFWRMSKWRPGTSWHSDEIKKIWHFSSNLVAFNVVNYFVRNGDSALVGRYLGAVSLGWYSAASRLLLFPTQNLTLVLGRALLPVYSRRQESLAEIATLYLRTLRLIAAVSAPMMFGLWAVRAPFVAVLLGPKWLPIAEILAWFAPMAFFQSLSSTTGTILSAIGRTDTLRTLGIVNSTLLLGAFIAGLQFGLFGLVIAYFFATLILTVSTMHITLTQVNSSLIEMVRRIAAPSVCAAAMAGTIALIEGYLPSGVSNLFRLLFLVPIGVMVYFGLIFIFAKSLVQELSKAVWR
jgi:O-antigen/teichoic acid export membrane protein